MRIFILTILFCLQSLAEGISTAADYVESRPEIFQLDRPEVLSDLRKQVGDKFAQEVMTYFMKEIVVKNRSCESFIGTCDFYLCQELKNPCGLEGYNLDFGYKYCSRSKFRLLDEMKTQLGKDWVPKTFQCLQNRNLADSLIIEQQADLKKDVCKLIKKKAIKSHPDCYVEGGYCELSILEKSNIVELVLFSALNPRTAFQGLKITHQCAKKIRD